MRAEGTAEKRRKVPSHRMLLALLKVPNWMWKLEAEKMTKMSRKGRGRMLMYTRGDR